MNRNINKIPYFDYDAIRLRAENFLFRYNPEDEIPVPIDKIVEIDFGIMPIPIPELMKNFNTDGYISKDFKTISIDDNIYNNIEVRCRFTYAHEIGHLILHKDIYSNLNFRTTEEWKREVSTRDPEGYMETQTNNFAGLILVPSPNLKEKLKIAEDKISLSGINPKKNPDLFQGYRNGWLAQEFFVSEETIRIRLEKDELL